MKVMRLLKVIVKSMLLMFCILLPLEGYPMAVYDVIPREFTNNDIRDTLNANGGSVTDEGITWFQERAKINMWAKYKPVRHSASFFLTEDQWRQTNYGIFTPDFNFDGKEVKVWEYRLPRGGDSDEPYRISDFIKYAPKSVCPIGIVFNHRNVYPHEYTTVEVLLIENNFGFDGDTNISIGSILRFPDLRLTLCLFDSSWNIKAYTVDAYKISERVSRGDKSFFLKCINTPFNNSVAYAGLMLTLNQPAESVIGTLSKREGYSIAYAPGVDMMEYRVIPVPKAEPPFKLNNATINGIYPESNSFRITNLTINFKETGLPKDSILLNIDFVTNSSMDGAQRTVATYTWTKSQSLTWSLYLTSKDMVNYTFNKGNAQYVTLKLLVYAFIDNEKVKIGELDKTI